MADTTHRHRRGRPSLVRVWRAIRSAARRRHHHRVRHRVLHCKHGSHQRVLRIGRRRHSSERQRHTLWALVVVRVRVRRDWRRRHRRPRPAAVGGRRRVCTRRRARHVLLRCYVVSKSVMSVLHIRCDIPASTYGASVPCAEGHTSLSKGDQTASIIIRTRCDSRCPFGGGILGGYGIGCI